MNGDLVTIRFKEDRAVLAKRGHVPPDDLQQTFDIRHRPASAECYSRVVRICFRHAVGRRKNAYQLRIEVMGTSFGQAAVYVADEQPDGARGHWVIRSSDYKSLLKMRGRRRL